MSEGVPSSGMSNVCDVVALHIISRNWTDAHNWWGVCSQRRRCSTRWRWTTRQLCWAAVPHPPHTTLPAPPARATDAYVVALALALYIINYCLCQIVCNLSYNSKIQRLNQQVVCFEGDWPHTEAGRKLRHAGEASCRQRRFRGEEVSLDFAFSTAFVVKIELRVT